MRARSRSYGDNSTRTRSPGRMRMRWRRILPATWPRTMWSLSSFTRNIAFGRASTTSPSNSTFSSLLTEGEGSAAALTGSAGSDVLRRVDRRAALRGGLRCGAAVVRPASVAVAVAVAALLLVGVLLLVRPAALGLVLGLRLHLLVL